MTKAKQPEGLSFLEKKRWTRYGRRTMHRWVLYGKNGEMIESSNEDFYNYSDCVNNAEITRDGLIKGLSKLSNIKN